MADLIKHESGAIEQFDPSRYRLKQAALDYGIEEAKAIKDWPTLEHAIDAKIDEQCKFVAWWNANVAVGRGARTELYRDRDKVSWKDAERLTGMKQPRVSELGKRLAKPEKYRKHLLGAGYAAAFLSAVENVRGTQGTGENEWFTPAQYIELVREVLGEIELDPATHESAQATIKATRYFTKSDNGLDHEWHGRVWLNPPYAQPWIEQFVRKLLFERAARRVKLAIMLTHNYTDTSWFQAALHDADAICFTAGRVKFYQPDGTIAAPTQGQAFFYFGDQAEKFARVFVSVGSVSRWCAYAQQQGMAAR